MPTHKKKQNRNSVLVVEIVYPDIVSDGQTAETNGRKLPSSSTKVPDGHVLFFLANDYSQAGVSLVAPGSGTESGS